MHVGISGWCAATEVPKSLWHLHTLAIGFPGFHPPPNLLQVFACQASVCVQGGGLARLRLIRYHKYEKAAKLCLQCCAHISEPVWSSMLSFLSVSKIQTLDSDRGSMVCRTDRDGVSDAVTGMYALTHAVQVLQLKRQALGMFGMAGSCVALAMQYGWRTILNVHLVHWDFHNLGKAYAKYVTHVIFTKTKNVRVISHFVLMTHLHLILGEKEKNNILFCSKSCILL